MCLPQTAINSASNTSPVLGSMLSFGKNAFTTAQELRAKQQSGVLTTVSRTTPAVFGGSRTKTMSVGTLG